LKFIISNLVCIFLLFSSANVFSIITDDSIIIDQVFVTAAGMFAVKGVVEISNASASRNCAPGKTWAKYWAGFGKEVDERVISVLLLAHAQKKAIQIRTDGCEGDWHKITSVYIK
jgi:uncharacterized caspase-like protein